MTKKDYIAIADGIKESVEDAIDGSAVMAVRVTAQKIAHRLKQDNGRFNEDKFLAACGFN